MGLYFFSVSSFFLGVDERDMFGLGRFLVILVIGMRRVLAIFLERDRVLLGFIVG